MPFLFANNGSEKTVTTAIILSCTTAAALGATLLGALFAMRYSIRNAVRSYNNATKAIVNDINASLKQISKYLGEACNVRRGHIVQNFADKNVDEYTTGLRIRKKHQEDVKKKRASIAEEYSDYLCDKTFYDETMTRPYDYDFNRKIEYDYPAPFLAGDSRQIEFINNGNLVTVPSSYVTRISVRLEEIYDK